MTRPVSTKMFGGLTYNENDVTRTVKNQNGTFTLIFKDGAKLTYPKQEEGQMGRYGAWNSIIVRNENEYNDDNTENASYTLSSIMGATFTSSNKLSTRVTLDYCGECNVDLKSNKLDGDIAHVNDGYNNVVDLGEHDVASFGKNFVWGAGKAAQKDCE